MIESHELKNRDRYLKKLIGFQDTEPVKVITGIRRCGKSSLLKLMIRHLRETGIQKEQIVEMDINLLRTFKDHPFKVTADYPMIQLKESIENCGILTPLLVRPLKDGSYEIISGHRRKHAAQMLGLKTVPVIIRKMGYDDAMLIVQDQVWNRVTINRNTHKSTRYYIDEFHLLLKEEQTAAYSVEIWKRFRKWGGIPTGITQNIKDLLASREIENIFENSDFILMLNQAAGDRQILAKQLNISPYQLSYVTNSGEGEGLLFYGSTIIPFKDKFDKTLKLYSLMTTKPEEVEARKQKEMEE